MFSTITSAIYRLLAGWPLPFGEFLKPRLKCQPGRRCFCFQHRSLFIGKLDHRHKRSLISIVTARY